MSAASLEIPLPDEAATGRLAQAVADALPADVAGWGILLQGELGAGKSTFARALIRRFGHQGPVPSPTYTLVEPYELARGQIYHVDLYRIADAEELEYLGQSDWQDGLLLLEWPERAPGVRETADLVIELDYRGNGRAARLTALRDRAAGLVASIHKASASF